MPIIKAAIKDLRQSQKHRLANREIKESMKDGIKKIMKLAQEKKFDEIAKKFPEVMSLIDKAAKNHLIHKNNAAHKKSRIAKLGATK